MEKDEIKTDLADKIMAKEFSIFCQKYVKFLLMIATIESLVAAAILLIVW